MAKKDSKSNQKGRSYFQSMYDRYVSAAKEANASSDKVAFEHNMQYAEHFIRIINERFQEVPESSQVTQDSQVPVQPIESKIYDKNVEDPDKQPQIRAASKKIKQKENIAT